MRRSCRTQSRACSAAILACATTGILYAAGAQAEQWQITPTASVVGEYSDNPRLLLENVEEAYGWLSDFQLGVTRATERTSIGLQSSLQYARYTDENDYDRNDRSLALDILHQAERSQWTADVQFVRDNTLTSEFETTGLVRTNKIHEAFQAAVGTTYQLTESWTAGSKLSWASNHYRDAEFSDLTDYDYGRVSVFGELQASDRSRWSLNASASELHSDFERPTTEDYSLMLRWTFVPRELWTVHASIGPSLSRSEVDEQDGAVYGLDVGRRSEKGSWSIAGSRERTPTGLGVLILADRLTLFTERALNETLNISLQGVAGRNRELLTAGGRRLELKFARLEARLGWELSRELRCHFTLAGIEQNNVNTRRAQNYSISIGISWNGESLYL